VEDNVVVGSGAKVLGSFIVGANSKIGAGSVVVGPVPANCTVVGVPGRIVIKNGQRRTEGDEIDLNHDQLPDPIAQMLHCMQNRIRTLEEKLNLHEQKD